MMTWWDLFSKTLIALSPVLLAALSWLSIRAAQLITAKVRNEYLQGMLLRLDDAIFVAIREVQQLAVEQLKTASADGSLSADDRKRVKEAALEAVRGYLGPKGLVEAGRVLGLKNGELDKVLSTRVEAAVYELNRPARVPNGTHG